MTKICRNSSLPTFQFHGFTLIETLISMVVLTIAFMLVFTLFQGALRYSSWIETRNTATAVAERKIEEIRGWAWTKPGTSYNFDGTWSTYSSAVTAPDTEYPEFRVRCEARGVRLVSPSTSFEYSYPGEEKIIDSSAMKVKVTVSWDQSAQTKQISLVSLVREPPRGFSSMQIVPIAAPHPSPLSKGASVQFTANAYEADGTTLIKDIFFLWYVNPATGNGTIEQDHTGSVATFYNKVRLYDGSTGYTGGTCTVKVRTVYYGVEYWAESATITLEP
ncbi:MAG: prepilin-type N-terminal cleavage/methylation domain-containing protein [Vulcanimicrobiota bacterium]